MFRYFRNFARFPRNFKVITLELNYFNFNKEENRYIRLSEINWSECIRVRELYFAAEGEFFIRHFNIDARQEREKKGGTVAEAVQWFFDAILHHVFQLR